MADTAERSMARPGVLRNPVLRAVLIAEFISSLGTQMTFVALPWFVFVNTESATRMGFVFAAELLPAALLGIPLAVVVQRIGVRRTMLIANVCRAPLLAAVPLLHALHLLSFPLLLVIVFAIGVFTAPYLSAQRLLLPETFANDESLVVQGNAVVEGVVRFGMLLGPAVAGVAITVVGAQNVLFFDAVTFLVAFLILRWRLPVAPADSPATDRTAGPALSTEERGMLAGARYVFANPLLRRITAASLLFGFFFPPLLASLPVLTAERYGEKPVTAGLLFAAWGAGAMAGTLTVLPFANRVKPMRLAAIGAAGLALPLWLLVLPLLEWQFAVVLVVSGLFTAILNAPVISLMMLLAPVEVRAKVVIFILTMNLVAGPIAYALTGPVLDHWGLTPVYVFVAVGVTGAAALLVSRAFARTDEPTIGDAGGKLLPP